LGIVSSHNLSSIRVLEKIGLVFEEMITLHTDQAPIKLFSTRW